MDTAIIEEEDVENIIAEDDDDGKINPLDGFTGEEVRNPVKAIREKCKECSCFSTSEIRNCVIKNCALFPFRTGHNPFRTREMTNDQRQSLVERGRKMAAIRAARKTVEKEMLSNIPVKKLRV
jgi:hypothetical protein